MIIHAAGRTLSELLEDSGRRLFAQLTDPEEVGEALREKISVEGADSNELVMQWMNTLLELARVQLILLKSCRINIQENAIPPTAKAEILGELFDPQRHIIRPVGACEAVEVRQGPKGYVAEIKFNDIP